MKFRLNKNIVRVTTLSLLFVVPMTLKSQNTNILKNSQLRNNVNNGSVSISERQKESIQKEYSARVEAPKEIINGREYESYYTRSQHKPLLYPTRKKTAVIYTQSRQYTVTTIQYDTFLDQLVYTDTGRIVNFRYPEIALNNDIIEGFNLYLDDDSLHFRNPGADFCAKAGLREGYYEFVYTGSSSYLIKHSSSYYTKEGRNEYQYTAENYMSTGGKYHRIKSKGDLLSLFSDRKQEIKRFIKDNRIRIRQSGKTEFSGIIRYYDSLHRITGKS
jgi:hypothetical protein